MKRFLSLFLAAAVLISCLFISVSAESVESASSFESSFVDLLDTIEWIAFIDGEEHSTRPLPSIYPNNASSVRLRWRCDTTANLVGFNFCLYMDRAPETVTFSLYDGRTVTPTLVSTVGKFYYYNYVHSNAFDYGNFSVEASWSSAYTGAFRIVNCYGYVPDAFLIEQGDVYHDVEYNDGGWRVDRLDSLPGTTFPKTIDYAYQISFFSMYTINLKLPVSNASSLSFNFTSLGSTVNESGVTVGVYKGATLQYQLPIELIQGMGINTNLVDGEKAVLYSYTCNVDLDGVDLSDYIIKIKIEIDSWYSSPLYQTQINLVKFAYKQSVYNYPWYRRFYNWISAKMTAGYQSIVDAINGEGNEEMEEAGNQMQGAADDLNQSADAFDQVETPDIDAGALTGDLTNFSVSGLAVLGVITANPYVTSLLVLVFTFALCAYIFFGKKG